MSTPPCIRTDATLTVTDPAYKGRRLTIHHELTPRTARELVAIYRALGYPVSCLTVDRPRLQEVA